MGCSASRSSPPFQFTTTINHQNPPSNSSNSSPLHHHFCSPFSDHYYNSSSTQTPVSRTMSIIHHPPLCKGDSNHFVSLTSTTYGSLIITNNRKTKTESPVSSPDSVINTWELMEGLEEELEFNNIDFNSIVPNAKIIKPLWQHLSEELNLDSNSVSKLVPNPVTEIQDPTYLSDSTLWQHLPEESISVSKLVPNPVTENQDSKCGDRVVLYYTTLRGIRKTYENCCEIRLILKGYRVFVDERDISMDLSYRKELESVFGGKGFTLPQVFIRGKHVGGADEIKRLHEEGELFNFMKGFRVFDHGFVCDHCGDVRFVPCPNCNGSRKVYVEDEGRSIRCAYCNENGLIRCATCCS